MSRAARLGRAAAAGCAGLLLALGTPGSLRSAAGPQALPADAQEFSGVLLPGMTALIKSRYKERVAEVPFAQGSRVQKGQLILRFADDQYRVERDRAAALLERAQADFDRAKQLNEHHDLSGQEFERAQTDLKLARADLELATLRLTERSILAPFGGVLAERHVDPGASVDEGDPLLRVTAITPLRLEVLLPETLLARLRSLPVLQVTLASPETTLRLVVRKVPVVVDPASGMFPLQIEVDNSRGRLVPGVSCRVRITEPVRARP